MPGGEAGARSAAADDTAKTLIVRSVCFEPHSGQVTFSVDPIDFSSFSNRWSHLRQAYSYIGMRVTRWRICEWCAYSAGSIVVINPLD